MVPVWLRAGLWGLVAGAALLVGAAGGYLFRVAQRFIAVVMAFGSGVLISALAFELMDEAYRQGGFDSSALGFVGGALVYTAANIGLARQGAKHRKRSGEQQPSEVQQGGSGLATALGALLDGIPESIVIGVSLLGESGVSFVAVAAGAVLAMLADTMIPEAFETAHDYTGLVFRVFAGVYTLQARGVKRLK